MAALAAVLVVLLAASPALAQGVRTPTAAQEAENARAERATTAAKEALAAGDDARALELAEDARRRFERLFGPDDVGVASAIETTSAVLARRGDYAGAEAGYLRELAILEKALGPRHAALARPLNALAVLYHAKGDPRRSLAMAERALAIVEQAVGPDHPNVATLLNNIAEARRAQGDAAAVEPLLVRALAIREKALGPLHRDVAVSLTNLSVVTFERGKIDEGLALLRRALAIEERVLGPDHPEIVTTLNDLAFQTEAGGDDRGAEALYLRALGVGERATPDHPHVAGVLDNLAALAWRTGRMGEALAFQTRANAIRERHIAGVIATGSERDRRLFLASSGAEANGALSLHLAGMPGDPAAARMALTLVLQRKGRLVDVSAATMATLRGHLGPEERSLYDRDSALRSKLAEETLAGPRDPAGAEAHRRAVEALRVEADELERRLAAKSAAFRAKAAPVTLESVQAAVPADAALVELVRYRPFDPRARGGAARSGGGAARSSGGAPPPERYAAYVLLARGDPAAVDLGDAAAIDAAASALRGALGDPSAEARGPARSLDALVMQPVRRLLGGRRRVLLAPDGALHLVPFGALVDESGHHLLESFAVSYLTSGRDLLRATVEGAVRSRPLVVVSPDFGAAPARSGAAAGGGGAPMDRGAHERGLSFSPLPGAAQEGAAIARLLSGASLLTGAGATEDAVKRARAPTILHIATHGFFLGDVASAARGARGLALEADAPARAQVGAHPLLRAGLAFAGANLGRGERGEDGVLTAYEASSLDLWGTKLVVLSACETGVGQIANGDGVYGLRRALVVAGAETVVTSLWKVDDEATRDLMVAYYGALQRGGGRGEALRQAQLAMRADPARSHPYFWATFIALGDWRTLDGREVAVDPAGAPAAAAAMRVAPARGCGCRVEGEGSSRARWPTLAIAFVVLLLFVVRSRAGRRPDGVRASDRR